AEGRVVGIAQETSGLVTEDNSLPEQRGVLVALVLVGDHHLLPDLRVLRVLHGREKVRVFEGQPELAFILTLALLQFTQDVLGDAVELLTSEPDTTILLVEVLLELNANLAQTLLNLLEPIPLLTSRKTQSIADII